MTMFRIDDYGDVDTLAAARLAFASAVAAAEQVNGTVVITADIVAEFAVSSSQSGVTVLDLRGGAVQLQTALETSRSTGSDWSLNTSLAVRRSHEEFDTGPGLFSVPVTMSVSNRHVHGGSSQRTQLLDPDGDGVAVLAGPAARFYPASIEGISVGQRFDVSDRYKPDGSAWTVTAIGWDATHRMPYFEADNPAPIAASTGGYEPFIANKSVIGGQLVQLVSHAPNQAPAHAVHHLSFAEDDTFGSLVLLTYQGNVMSALGDEGAVAYVAEVAQDVRVFRGTVATFDPAEGRLTFSGGQNLQRLGTARPLVNLAQSKWLTAGKARVWISTTYPNAALGITGGVVEGVGTSWGPEVVGRYFAVDEPSERIEANDPHVGGFSGGPPAATLRRWFRICKFQQDGAKQLLFVRFVQWGTAFGSPVLADGGLYYNYTQREVDYVIAPGAVVCDVREGVAENENAPSGHALLVQPTGDFGAPGLPFAPGDPVEQAIGPQPWNPTGFRVRHFNNIPSVMPEASFLTVNGGTAPVGAGLDVAGNRTMAAIAGRFKGSGVEYGAGVSITAVTEVGIAVRGEVKHAPVGSVAFLGVGAPDGSLALVLDQSPGDRKNIAWTTRNPGLFATMGYHPDDQRFRVAGGPLDLAGAPPVAVPGLSGSAQPARNLRGLNVAAAPLAALAVVAFATAEADAAYTVQVTPSWPTAVGVNAKTAQGFTVTFGTPAPAGATFDWVLVR